MSPTLQRAALDQHGRDRTAAAIELGFDHGAFGRTFRIGLEVEQFGLQRDHLEQLVEIGLVLGGHFDVDDVAAERFDLHFVLQQFGAHALRLGVGLVDLVDRHDHRNLRRLGVVDGFDGLRHDAVIGRHHQDHDVGDLGAAGAHRGERGVAGRIDEGDLLAAFRRGHLIGADMLGDAAGFAGDHVGVAQRVEQRGLAVVDMAHHGHDRRTRLGIAGIVDDVEQAFFNVGRGDALDGVAHFLGDQLRGVGIDHVGDLVHRALLHQQADDVDRTFRHAVGEFLDVDGFRNHHLTDQLFLRLIGGVPFQALGAAAERGDRTLAHVVGIERRDQRQAATILLRAGFCGCFRGHHGAHGAAGAATDLARTFIFVGSVGRDTGRTRRGYCRSRAGRAPAGRGAPGRAVVAGAAAAAGLGFGFAETLLGFDLGLALGFLFDAGAVLPRPCGGLRRLRVRPARCLPCWSGAWLLPRRSGALRLHEPWRRPARWRAPSARLRSRCAARRRNRCGGLRVRGGKAAPWRREPQPASAQLRPARAHGFRSPARRRRCGACHAFRPRPDLVRPWLKLWRTVPVSTRGLSVRVLLTLKVLSPGVLVSTIQQSQSCCVVRIRTVFEAVFVSQNFWPHWRSCRHRPSGIGPGSGSATGTSCSPGPRAGQHVSHLTAPVPNPIVRTLKQ